MSVGASLFTERDRAILDAINAQLALVVYLAAEKCPLRLDVIEGYRTERRQAELVRAGASKTMASRHITGHAVDLAPIVDGTVRWDWPLYYHIAAAMRYAAVALDVPVRWGGVWDTPLRDLPETAVDIEGAQAAYVERCRAKGQRAFLDGPHFEIPFTAPGYA
jgi:peptidoglycan L-alanyl-D-glutamate endopeptidase CwlK